MEIHERFKDADWFDPNETTATVGGAGGIGSYLCFLLTRQNVIPICYDFDIIETHNLGGQLYRTVDIGKTKVSAIKEIIYSLTGKLITDVNRKFDNDSYITPIAFSAFDSMEARKVMFERWCSLPDKQIFIDGRMNAEQGQIYFVTPDRIEDYKKTLFEDSEVEELPCTYKSTSYCATMIASVMIAGFNNYRANIKTKTEIRELPFEVHYMLQLFKFNVNFKTVENETVPAIS